MEVQVAYIASTLIKPIIDGYSDVIEVKPDAEEKFVRDLDDVLNQQVFSAGCSNWYINSAGRNSAAWPGLAVTFWKATAFTRWKDFVMTGGSKLWFLRKAWRSLTTTSPMLWLVLLATAARVAHKGPIPVSQYAAALSSRIKAFA